MICPNCGTANADGSRFCEECGTLLVSSNPVTPVTTDSTQNSVQQPAQNNNQGAAKPEMVLTIPKIDGAKSKDFLKKKLFIIIPVVVVLVALITFIGIGSSISSPEKVVEKYVEALAVNDYATMYECMALPEGKLINEEAYENYMLNSFGESGNSFEGISKFRIEEIRSEADLPEDLDDLREYQENSGEYDETAPVRNFSVSAVDPVSGYREIGTFSLVEQEEKTMLFFNQYKISAGDYVVQNVKIYTDSFAKLYIDDILLEEKATNEDGLTYYEIDAAFRGMHKLTLTSDIFETYETEISLYDSEDSESVYLADEANINQNVVSDLEAKAFETVKNIYASAAGKKTADSLGIKVASYYTEFAEEYADVVDKMTLSEQGTGLKAIAFTSGAIEDGDYTNCYTTTDDQGNLIAYFDLEVAYNYTTLSRGFFSTEIKENKGSYTDEIRFRYAYIDGDWYLAGLNDVCVYTY